MAIEMDLRRFLSQVGVRKKKISPQEIMPVVKDAIIIAYHYTVENTPQYSGYLASNLRLGFNGNYGEVALDLYEAHENWRKLDREWEVKEKGDEYAMGIASSYNSWFNDVQFTRYTDKVGLKYRAPHWRVAEEGTKLREVNKPGKALATAETRMKSMYHAKSLRPKTFGTERV